jgi:hypothetical protein
MSDWLELLSVFFGVLGSVSLAIVAWCVKYYIPGYLKTKGQNLATKEDIASITREVEGVKEYYTVELEKYKNAIWRGQQREVWFKEEFKLRLETYKKATLLIYKYLEYIKNFHVSHLSSGINEAICCHLERENYELKEIVGGDYRVEYESTREKSLEWYFKCKDIEIELREVLGVVDVYFDDDLSRSLDALVRKGVDAARTYCGLEGFYELVESEFRKSSDYSDVSSAVMKNLHSEFQKLVPEVEAQTCLERLKKSIVQDREKILGVS